MHKYIIIGPQGSGKGTQAQLLQRRFKLEHICIGDILRWNIQHHTKLGSLIQGIVATGEMVPDDLVQDLVRERLAQHDWNYGFILDGFPRNRAQAQFYLENYDVDAVLVIEVPEALVFKRTLGRRYCGTCGLDYNLIHHRPAVQGVCDVCGSPLSQRADDRPDVLRYRLQQYHEQTLPMIELFSQRKRVITIDGCLEPNIVQERICLRLQQTEAVLV